MAQQPNQQRQLSWAIAEDLAKPDRILNLAKEFKSGNLVGSPANVTVNLNGSPLGINIKGEVDEALNDLEALSNHTFMASNFQAQHPKINNLNVNVTLNIPLRQLTVNIQNGNDDQVEKIFDFIQSKFPRHPDPSDEESSKLSLRLVSLVEEAEKASSAVNSAKKDKNDIENLLSKSKEYIESIESSKNKIEESYNNISNHQEEIKKFSADISRVFKTLCHESKA